MNPDFFSCGAGGVPVMPRRHFLWTTAGGIGGIALAWMLERESRAAAPETAAGAPASGGHFPARAKRVVQIFCAGGVSHLDTFDYKPDLEKLHGQSLDNKGENKAFSVSQGA